MILGSVEGPFSTTYEERFGSIHLYRCTGVLYFSARFVMYHILKVMTGSGLHAFP